MTRGGEESPRLRADEVARRGQGPLWASHHSFIFEGVVTSLWHTANNEDSESKVHFGLR
jgi:hypothetical protein